MLIVLRIVIVVIAALEIFWFSEAFDLTYQTLAEGLKAQWFNVASALASGVIAPVLALAAAALAVVGKRLGLAAIVLCTAPLIYALPVIAFTIGIMIYGF
jgi:hypothetical protein